MSINPEFRNKIPSSSDSLSILQKQLETKLDYAKITSGAHIPLDLLKNYFSYLTPNSLVVNLGSGNGVKANNQADLARLFSHRMIAADFNEAGIRNGLNDAKSRGSLNVEHRKLDLIGSDMVQELGGRKSVGLAIMEALMCNLIGVDAEVFVAQLGSLLVDGGYAVVADCLTVDDPESRELLEESKKYPQSYIYGWAKSWHERYKNNSEALHTKPEDYTFVVMPPGEEKQRLEYSDSRTILKLVADKKIERLARHWEKRRLVELFRRAHMELVEWSPKVWISRANEPLLGEVAVFQKQEVRYDGVDTIVRSLALPIFYASMYEL